eukprot:364647-Chlamydomonas_euryale.AAC.23
MDEGGRQRRGHGLQHKLLMQLLLRLRRSVMWGSSMADRTSVWRRLRSGRQCGGLRAGMGCEDCRFELTRHAVEPAPYC